MKITCPTNKVEEAVSLIEAGADELYLGYISKRWYKKYSLLASANRRYFKESSFTDMKDIKQLVGSSNVPVYLTMNAPSYSSYWGVMSDIKKAVRAGVNGFIVADIPLMIKINKKYPDKKLIVSTVACSLNSDSAKFYKRLGAHRLVLPRHLKFDEIKNIRQNVDIELETFMLFDWCKNLDGLCTYHHGMEDILGVEHGCTFVNDYTLNSSHNLAKKRMIDNRIKNVRFDNFCAVCNIERFKDIGIDAVKIAGRRLPTEIKLKAVKFVKDSFSGDCEKKYFSTFNKRCPRNCNAY